MPKELKSIEINKLGKIEYETKRSFEDRYPKELGGFTVVGAIGDGLKDSLGNTVIEGKDIPYFSLKYNKVLYGIVGYIEIGEDTFVAVLKNKMLRNSILLLVSLAIIAGIVIVSMNLGNASGPDLDAGSKKYKPNVTISDKLEKGRIAIPGYTDIKMEAGTDTAYVALWNPEENPCYFKFTILLEDGEKTIYQSKLIPPGEAITTVKFSQEFAKGEYPIIVRIDTYDLNNYETKMNGGEVNARIVSIETE